MRRTTLIVAWIGAAFVGCDGAPDPRPPGPTVVMDFASRAFFDAPFPSDHRLDDAGKVDLSGFPNPDDLPVVDTTIAMLHGEAGGFSLTAAIHFRTTVPVAVASLPSLAASIKPDASAFLVRLDNNERVPVRVAFTATPGPFGAANLLSLLPLQGIALRPATRYAAVVTSRVTTAAGARFEPAKALVDLVAGRTPAGLKAAAATRYSAAIARLKRAGVDATTIVGLAVFTTGRPADGLAALVTAMAARPLPAPIGKAVAKETFADYCTYELRYRMPVYQAGTAPYTASGGAIAFDAAGVPAYVRAAESRLIVTVPRKAMPPRGWPTAVFIRTGGGGDRPLVDRGPRDKTGKAIAAGTGPSRELARAGWAGASIDGPHGGLRNPSKADEQLLIFNFLNPPALRDNLRQSAAELTLLPKMLAALRIDVTGCAGASAPAMGVQFDDARLALVGHSMGATIAPLTLAESSAFTAAVLSGAGGSWIENVLYKTKPLPVRVIFEALLRYRGYDARVHRHEPFLNVLQWAGEAADPPVYGRRVVHERAKQARPRHVLMLQGVVDNYILPSIANAMTLSVGLDLAGRAADAADPRLKTFAPLSTVLGFAGRKTIALPARGNVRVDGQAVTAVVVQHTEDGVEDGHEVAFQVGAARRQYRCFLASLLSSSGAPTVPADGAADAACP